MMRGADGRYVICERVPKEQPSAVDRLLSLWNVSPVAAFEDPVRAHSVLDSLETDKEGGVFGVLDTETNEWVVYPKPRSFVYRWRRRRFRRWSDRQSEPPE
jgi:hypothetical protein